MTDLHHYEIPFTLRVTLLILKEMLISGALSQCASRFVAHNGPKKQEYIGDTQIDTENRARTQYVSVGFYIQ